MYAEKKRLFGWTIVMLWLLVLTLTFHAQAESCMWIHSLELEGNRQVLNALSKTLRFFKPRCFSAQGIQAWVDRLRTEIVNQGYLGAQLVVPEQNVSKGRLKLHLSVPSLRVLGRLPIGSPIQDGDYLNLRDLQQGLYQFRQLKTQSESVIVLKNKPFEKITELRVVNPNSSARLIERMVFGFTLDYPSAFESSALQGGTTLHLENPLALNDKLAVFLQSPLDHIAHLNRHQAWGFQYQLPWRYQEWSVQESVQRFKQYLIWSPDATLLWSYRQQDWQWHWRDWLFTDSRQRLALDLGLLFRSTQSFIDQHRLETQSHRKRYYEIGFYYQYRGDRDQMALAFQHRQARGLALDSLTATYQTPHYSAYLKAHSGDASNTLFLDRFSLGALDTVRGFDGKTLVQGNRGVYLKQEWLIAVQRFSRSRLPSVFSNTDLFLFFDWGAVHGAHLSGSGLGLVYRLKGLAVKASIGRPVFKPKGFKSRPWTPVVSFHYQIG